MAINVVPSPNGWLWITAAFALFRKNPLIWLVLHVALLVIALALSALPLIGPYLVYLFAPLLFGGMMSAAKDQEAGLTIGITHLFRGFRRNAVHLITLGGVYLVGQVLISGLMQIMGGAELQAIMEAGIGKTDPSSISPEAASRVLMVLMLGLILFVPLSMATWFSPARVMLDDQPPLAALRESLRACVRNLPAFLIYGIMSLLLLFAALIPFGLGLILWIPVTVLSWYTSYRDVFSAPLKT
jgi:uncharacterized membrane protein